MKTLQFLLEKEFRQVFRNPAIVRMIFLMPIVQLIVMPLAADYEVKNVQIITLDHDKSVTSTALIKQIVATKYFQQPIQTNEYTAAFEALSLDKADIIVEIPAGFEKQLTIDNKATLLVEANAVNGVKANLGAAYLNNIINNFNNDIRLEKSPASAEIQALQLQVSPQYWYNKNMNYQYFMVPGILVILVTMVGSFLTALNIVKEKETGTIEQINVTPIKKHQFILGKLIPFWVLGMLVLTVGLLITRLVYGIVPQGGILPLYCFAALYLLAIAGLGLLISTYAQTQQQAMLISFFVMMLFILLGGLYTAIESMPSWAQQITKLNPAAYFIEVMRSVVLKGSGIAEILPQLGAIALFALVFNIWAIINYRKTI